MYTAAVGAVARGLTSTCVVAFVAVAVDVDVTVAMCGCGYVDVDVDVTVAMCGCGYVWLCVGMVGVPTSQGAAAEHQQHRQQGTPATWQGEAGWPDPHHQRRGCRIQGVLRQPRVEEADWPRESCRRRPVNCAHALCTHSCSVLNVVMVVQGLEGAVTLHHHTAMAAALIERRAVHILNGNRYSDSVAHVGKARSAVVHTMAPAPNATF